MFVSLLSGLMMSISNFVYEEFILELMGELIFDCFDVEELVKINEDLL